MFRALRADKLIHRALETTLRSILLEQWDDIPALRMIRCDAEAIRARAEEIMRWIPGSLVEGQSVVGGGSTPGQALRTWLISLNVQDTVRVERRLRGGEPPVIARIEKEQLLIDLRTVSPEEDRELLAAIKAAL
jgi:L-seryl-tRNA(Ser) seleniumtransferase